MKIWLTVMAFLIGAVVVFFVMTEKAVDKGPRYTLLSFKRQWHVHSPSPKAHFDTPHKLADGHVVDYGNGVNLFIAMHKDTVTGIRIRYNIGLDQGPGGQRFLLLMHTAINVGTFRWPQERINEVRRFFSIMNPQPKNYRYLYTSFVRTHEPPDKWEFAMDFVPNMPEENSPAP